MQHCYSNVSRLKNIQELWVFWMKQGKALSFIGFAFSFENQFRCLWCQQQMKKYCPQLFFFFQFSSGNKYSCKEAAAAKNTEDKEINIWYEKKHNFSGSFPPRRDILWINVKVHLNGLLPFLLLLFWLKSKEKENGKKCNGYEK